ncbi:MAG: indole-3-glycerol phosphate synthase TrpC [Alicyclobacillaceae bacterium]|nr:indole-3-glycerol phosphate synthase TrpC [Alicyclobacillaceae bacterium]
MTILERIVARKVKELEELESDFRVWSRRLAGAPPVRDFRTALERGAAQRRNGAGVGLIAEVKKASPSKGLIRPDFEPVEIARGYEAGGTDCISVLTDREFFQGHPDFLRQIREAVSVPLLRKDFILEERQVWESRCLGADAVLLIAAILPGERLRRLIAEVEELGMTALVEVHTEEEMARAAEAGATTIGINNRDLRTFEVDLGVTERLAKRAPAGALLVSESGLFTAEDVVRVRRAGAGAVLVGESLMRQRDVARGIEALVGGR